MNNRIIQEIEPSSPWMWMALLTSEDNITSVLDLSGSSTGLSSTVSWAKDIVESIKTKDYSPLVTKNSDGESTLSGLIQSVTLPPMGFTPQYEDLGFIKYPTVGSILCEPLTLEYIETADNVVSRYFLSWLSEICPAASELKAGQASYFASEALYSPLDTKARSLFIIKLKRSVALGFLNTITERIKSGNISNLLSGISSGLYELPAQIFCFPKVVPQRITEGKLDKAESNSIRRVSVLLERVPTLLYAGKNGQMTDATQTQITLNAAMAVASKIEAASSALIGTLSAGSKVKSAIDFSSRIYTERTAAALVDKKASTES